MIETHDLTKMYGELYALNRLNLTLQQGDVYGFIGPNGAGKTTTMRILATLLNPSWGEATVCGYSIYTGSKEIRRVIGYMPDFFGVYDDMKVVEYLEFFASAYRIKGAARRKICEEVLELVDLTYKRDALVTSLSRGMTQRLGLARTLLHDPQVLLLDEPASGLDPRARIEMRALLKELRNMGKTILVSSHILPELADICNKIGIIEQGCLLVNGEVSEVMKQVRTDIVLNVAVADRLTDAAGLLENQPEVESVQDKNGVLIVKLNEGVSQYGFLANRLVEQGYELTLFKEDEINLETAFMHLTKGITPPTPASRHRPAHFPHPGPVVANLSIIQPGKSGKVNRMLPGGSYDRYNG
jgi:ABC-2 type transport system ATP-binding protein